MNRWVHILTMLVLMFSQTGFTWVSNCCSTDEPMSSCHEMEEMPSCCSELPADDCCNDEETPIIINPHLIPFTVEDNQHFSFQWAGEEAFSYIELSVPTSIFKPQAIRNIGFVKNRQVLFQQFRC